MQPGIWLRNMEGQADLESVRAAFWMQARRLAALF